MAYRPGDTLVTEFTTQNSTGAATNADSLPTATLAHNGTVDGSVTLTVANVAAGVYSISGTIPSGYSAGDSIAVVVAATISSITAKDVVYSAPLDRTPPTTAQIAAAILANPSDLLLTDSSGHVTLTTGSLPANFASLGITSGGKITEVALVDTLTTYTGNTPQTGDSFARIGAAGASLTSIPYTGPSAGTIQAGLATSSAVAALATTLGTPAGASVSADIATANSGISTANTGITNLAAGNGLFVPGTISTATSASSIIVQFTGSAPPAAGLPGLFCCITSAARAPEKQQIATATIVDSTHLTLTFSTAFGVAPSNGDSVLIG